MLQFLLNNFKLMAKNVQKRNKQKSAILNFYQMCVSESDGSCLCQACKFMKHITCVNLFMKHIIFVFPCNMYGGPNPPLYKTFAPRFYKTFAPRFYNFLHDITISSTILQFPPRFYNFLHDFTIFSTILQFPPRFYKTFAPRFYKTFSPRYYKIVEQIIKSWRKL